MSPTESGTVAHPIATARTTKISKGKYRLEVASQEMVHPDGRKMLLLGLVHVAEPDYFDHVRKIALEAEANGFTVLWEGLHTAPNPHKPESLNQAAANAGNVMTTAHRHVTKLFDLPWVYQGDTPLCPFPETWRHSDSRAMDIALLLGTANTQVLNPFGARYEYYKALKEKVGRYGLRYQIERSKYIGSHIVPWQKRGRAYRMMQRQVFRLRRILFRMRKPKADLAAVWKEPYTNTFRECLAALTALHNKAGNSVLLWHPGHLAHIGQIFARNGFVASEPQWITAINEIELIEKEPKDAKVARKRAAKEAKRARKHEARQAKEEGTL